MGDRQSDRSQGGPADGAGPALESLLAGVLRSHALDADAEQRAVAAFRDARDAGAHHARTRRRDDWSPREHGRRRRSLRATFTLSLAGLTLGGVAYAAIENSVGGSPDDGHAARQRTHAPVVPSATPSRTPGTSTAPGAPAAPDRPATAKDTEAHCRAYEKVKGNGKALGSTAWQRLIAAAGGEENVAAYCAGRPGGGPAATTTPPASKPGNGKGTGKVNGNSNANGNGKAKNN